MRTERELLVDCLVRLNSLGVAYMLVGSMASNYWGIPRTTHDLDFVLVLRQDDVEPLVDAFSSGFFVQRESVKSAFRPPHQFNAIDEQSALKIDFWLLKDEPFERAAFGRRRQVTLFETPAWLMTAEDVILHKLYWDSLSPSERQLFDVAGVYAVQGDLLDMAHLHHWAKIIGVEARLEELIAGKIKPKSS